MEVVMESNLRNTKKIALSGVLGALAVVCLLLAVVLPTSKLAFYVLSSFFISVIVIEYNIKAGWLFYAATSLLSFIILPDKLGIVPYLIFFGLYGLVKFYIEKISKAVPEYMLKYVYFNLSLSIAYYLVREIFLENITVGIPWWAAVIGLEIVFAVYDYVYTLFIGYYRMKLKKVLGF